MMKRYINTFTILVFILEAIVAGLPISIALRFQYASYRYVDISLLHKTHQQLQEALAGNYHNSLAESGNEDEYSQDLSSMFVHLEKKFDGKKYKLPESEETIALKPIVKIASKVKSERQVANSLAEIAPLSPVQKQVSTHLRTTEISSGELIHHYGFAVNKQKQLDFVKLSNLATENVKKLQRVEVKPLQVPEEEEMVPDENVNLLAEVKSGEEEKELDNKSITDKLNVVQSQAENQKNEKSNIKDVTLPKEDDLVFYDLKENKKFPNNEGSLKNLRNVEEEKAPAKVAPELTQVRAPKKPSSPDVFALGSQANNLVTPSVYNAIKREMNTLGQAAPVVTTRKNTFLAQNNVNTQKMVALPGLSKSLQDLDNRYPRVNTQTQRPQEGMMPSAGQPSPFVNDSIDNDDIDNRAEKYSNSLARIRVTDAELNKGLGEDINSFDFRPFYNYDEILSDNGEGVLSLDNMLYRPQSILSAGIYKKDRVLTNVDLTLDKAELDFSIPLISVESLERFLKKYRLQGLGGFLLIELDERTEDVKIDGRYEAKFFLDKNLKVVGRNAEPYYMFFVGAEPGNHIASYAKDDGEVLKKIIYIKEDELTFEMNAYVDRKAMMIELYETNVFGKIQSELNILPSQIKFFNAKKSIKRRGLNRYEIVNAKLPMGTRAYLELDHLLNNIFVGIWNNQSINVPSNEYVVQIFNTFGIDNISSQCLVQVNLSKETKEFTYSGSAANGLNLRVLYLDKDGTFSDEISERTIKVFILGDNEGSIDAKIDYLDRKVDFLKTYCSRDTYLVEQL